MNKQEELAAYTKQLAFLTGRGISLQDAVANTCKDISCKALKEKISGALSSRISQNNNFSDILKDVFPQHILTLIRAGEKEKKLSAILFETASVMEAEEEKRQIANKMTGLPLLPFFVFLIGIIYVICIQYSFVNNFYKSMDLELHQITQWYLAFCSFIDSYPIILLVLCAFAVMQFLFQLSDKTKNRFLYRIPVLSKSVQKFYEQRAFLWITLMEKTGIARNQACRLLAEGTDFNPERERLNNIAGSSEKTTELPYEPEWRNQDSILWKRQGTALNIFTLFYTLTEAFVLFIALISFLLPLYGGCIHCLMGRMFN